MDQVPMDIKIDDYWNPELHAFLFFLLYLTNPVFYYISAGLARSFSHGEMFPWWRACSDENKTTYTNYQY